MNQSKPEQLNAINHNVKRIKTLTSVSILTGPSGADANQFRANIRVLLRLESGDAFSNGQRKIQTVSALQDNGVVVNKTNLHPRQC